MEYQLDREKCPVCETVFEGTSEQPIDLDFSLPDYCPDIERILKCRVCPSVTSKTVSDDRLDVDGTAVIRLYYLDARKQAVRLCEHTSPFSCSFSFKTDRKNPTAVIKLRTEYLNCRALSPRRLDIHGAFSVSASVYAQAEQELYENISGDNIQQRKHSMQMSRLSSLSQQQFSLSEVLDIGQGKGVPESILRSELTVRIDDHKNLTDKMMLRGEAVLRILYVTDIETGTQDSMTFNIPFSHVTDAQGISDNSQSDIIVEVMNYDVSLKSEFDQSSTLVTLDARLCATVISYETISTDVIDDAYSTSYETELSRSQCRFTRLMCILDSSFTSKGEIKTGDSGITKIIDVWSDGISCASVYENHTLTVKGKVNCCLLGLDNEGIPFYVERPVEFSSNPVMPEEAVDIKVRTDLSVRSVGFMITSDNTVEIKAEIHLGGAVFENSSCMAICGISVNDEKRREKDENAALTLYYADEGENLWSIARSYCTSVEAIRIENDLTDDIISARGMILIPM